MKYTYITILTLAISSLSFGQSTGYKSAGVVSFSSGWTNSNNLLASDNLNATALKGSGCWCPQLEVSGDGGSNFVPTTSKWNYQSGPFSYNDKYFTDGGSTDTWGKTWTDTEFSNANFVFRLSTSAGHSVELKNFNFGIPSGANIEGIEVQVEGSRDSTTQITYVDHVQVNVHYNTSTSLSESLLKENMINLFPLPVEDQLKVSGITVKSKYYIINSMGQIIGEGQLENDVLNEIDIQTISAGVYYLHIRNKEQQVSINKKFIVK